MSTVPLVSDEDASPAAQAVFDDIRETRGTQTINNFWRALAHNPAELERVWADVKRVMGPAEQEGRLDPLTKELIYIAVSVANACTYCAHSHTAAARQKGMTNELYAELMEIVSLAGRTNHLATMLQIPVDDAFDCS
ncbi:MAG: carboxymuconolactone decarboxylase family protein [Pseudomonadota bacterium]